LASSTAAAAQGGGRRIAVIIANDVGAHDDAPLAFAKRDALRVAQTFTELGSVAQSDLLLVLDGTVAEARRALDDAERRARQGGVLLLVYYSGHADGDALHLGPTRLSWAELRSRLKDSSAAVRLAVVDACQAGSLSTQKGLVPVSTSSVSPPTHRGTAFLMATEASELAQETPSLGGSFFTHYLISGLRGAADVDRDGRVTLAEAQSYATTETTRATAAWARSAQHPRYDFDLTGHGDLVLTSLREASATLLLASELEGHLTVAETGSPLALVELSKRAGDALPLALPNGRYVVHLRKESVVYVGEVVLPWGGVERLGAEQLSARSYQTVSQKGGRVDVYSHRLQLGLMLQSPIARGMGMVPLAQAQYGHRLGSFELAARLLAGRVGLEAIDTTVTTTLLGGGLAFAYEQPVGLVDLRGWVTAEVQLWQQSIALAPSRGSTLFGLGVGVGVRVPIWRQTFAELAAETLTYAVAVEGDGQSLRPTGAIRLSVGQHF
jgi:uncharacterized caspase-like protein